MNFYQVKYKISKNREFIYPKTVKDVVWKVTQNHLTENVIIGGTDSKLPVDGRSVIELTESQASKMIAEFKNSFPEIEKKATPIPEISSSPGSTRKKTRKQNK